MTIDWEAPASGAKAIDYSSTDQDISALLATGERSRGVYVTVAGVLVVEMTNGDAATFAGLIAGQVYPFRVRKIVKSGSTAAGYVLT